MHDVDTDVKYLRRAFRLARRGVGEVSPNPMVGAVVVREDRIVGEGYHARFGGPHAEVNALRQAGEQARGATMYVTLEPCCHQGKTPPCTEAIAAAGLSRVVVSSLDPNPLVNGRGVEVLRQAGIDVDVGVLEDQNHELNRGYFKWVAEGRPFVTAKAAITLDGRIATRAGDSKWISSPPARKMAHRLRSEHDAVLVGRGTLAVDDPMLTVRHVKRRNPLRIVVDETLELVGKSRVARQGEEDGKTIVATAHNVSPPLVAELQSRGIRVWTLPANGDGLLDTRELLRVAARDGITSILVEGGSILLAEIVRRRLVDRFVFFLAPKLFGAGISLIGDIGVNGVEHAPLLQFRRVRRVGPDLMVEAEWAAEAERK